MAEEKDNFHCQSHHINTHYVLVFIKIIQKFSYSLLLKTFQEIFILGICEPMKQA